MPATLGGDHSFKAGVRWRDTPAISTVHRGGFAIARFRTTVADGCWSVPTNGSATARCEAELYRDGYTEAGLTNLGFYLQDTWTRNKLTLNLAFRVDRQDDSVEAANVAANPLAPEWLPALTFNGADAGVVWTDVSPRLGMTYDFRATAARCSRRHTPCTAARWGLAALSGHLNPVTEAWVRFPWQDLNRDGFIQRPELGSLATGGPAITRGDVITQGGNYNPDNPAFAGTINQVSPDVKNERTREIIVSFDRQIGRSLAVGSRTSIGNTISSDGTIAT